MLPPKDIESTLLPTRIEAELALWARLAFSFDMDKGPHRTTTDNERAHSSRRSSSASQPLPGRSNTVLNQEEQDAVLSARFAAVAGGLSDGIASPHAFGSLMSSEGYSQPGYHGGFFNHDYDIGHGSLPPSPPGDFHWDQFPRSQSNQDQYGMTQGVLPNPGMLSFPDGYMTQSGSRSMTGLQPNAISTSRSSQPTVHNLPVTPSSTGVGSSHESERMTETERNDITEEKRRRNTAASARFRIKKKQRTTNLERSVSDLSGRAEDLEREAADLRRENGWLKEIVMLKGSRLAAVNLASHLLQSSSQGSTSRGQGNPSRPSEDNSSDSDEPSSNEGKKKGGKKK